jgi:hypothetical protein
MKGKEWRKVLNYSGKMIYQRSPNEDS